MVRDQIQTTDGAMITHVTYRHGMEAAKEAGEKWKIRSTIIVY